MNRTRQFIAAVLLCSAALPALANVSRDQAASVAQRETGGRVLSVERHDAGGRVVWRVKVVTARGDVRVILVDASTGQLY